MESTEVIFLSERRAKLKTIVLVIIIKPYMVFVFSDFDVKRKPNKTMKGLSDRATINDVEHQFSKVRGFPCSNMIGYERR